MLISHGGCKGGQEQHEDEHRLHGTTVPEGLFVAIAEQKEGRPDKQRGRDAILAELVRIQYGRNDVMFEQGTFRVRGDSIEIFPAYAEQAIRIELWGDEVERISKINPLTGDTIVQLDQCAIYPAKHFVTQRPTIERAVKVIREELAVRLAELKSAGKLLEAQRLESRTSFDVEMLLEVGTCAGIEN